MRVPLNTKIDENLKKFLQKKAREENRTVSNLVEKLAREYKEKANERNE